MISVQDFKTNPHWIFAAHELAAIVDPDMATKMTVQFNLFGGTVLKLGTEVLFRTSDCNKLCLKRIVRFQACTDIKGAKMVSNSRKNFFRKKLEEIVRRSNNSFEIELFVVILL